MYLPGLGGQGMSIEIDSKVNLGHILIMVGMLGSGISAYVAAKVTLNEHQGRLEVIEKNMDKYSSRAEDMNNNLWGIKSDIAIIRQKVELGLSRSAPK
jgi:ABC-type polar amino acid transport system ATPase subunit